MSKPKYEPKKPPFKNAFTYTLDERIPELGPVLNRHGIETDEKEFSEWLSPLINGFKRKEMPESGAPSITEEIAATQALLDASKAMMDAVANSSIPPVAWALMTSGAQTAGWPIHEQRDQVLLGAMRFHVLAENVIRTLKLMQKRGRPKSMTADRDELVAQIYDRLRLAKAPAENARKATGEILVACEVVKDPAALGDIQHAVKRGRN